MAPLFSDSALALLLQVCKTVHVVLDALSRFRWQSRMHGVGEPNADAKEAAGISIGII